MSTGAPKTWLIRSGILCPASPAALHYPLLRTPSTLASSWLSSPVPAEQGLPVAGSLLNFSKTHISILLTSPHLQDHSSIWPGLPVPRSPLQGSPFFETLTTETLLSSPASLTPIQNTPGSSLPASFSVHLHSARCPPRNLGIQLRAPFAPHPSHLLHQGLCGLS